MQKKFTKKGKRNQFTRLVQAKSDKDAINAWRQNLNTVLHLFSVRRILPRSRGPLTAPFQAKIVLNTNTIVTSMQRNKAGADHEHQPVRSSFVFIVDNSVMIS